jgi:hypothetical protein
MFAMGHVVEKEAVVVGRRSPDVVVGACWCSFVFIRAKEEAVSKSADAT